MIEFKGVRNSLLEIFTGQSELSPIYEFIFGYSLRKVVFVILDLVNRNFWIEGRWKRFKFSVLSCIAYRLSVVG